MVGAAVAAVEVGWAAPAAWAGAGGLATSSAVAAPTAATSAIARRRATNTVILLYMYDSLSALLTGRSRVPSGWGPDDGNGDRPLTVCAPCPSEPVRRPQSGPRRAARGDRPSLRRW